jgi:hypothetical protein
MTQNSPNFYRTAKRSFEIEIGALLCNNFEIELHKVMLVLPRTNPHPLTTIKGWLKHWKDRDRHLPMG